MILGVVLLAVGCADFFRPADRKARLSELVRSLLALVLVAVLATWATGAAAYWSFAIMAAGIGWVLLSHFHATWIASLVWAATFGFAAFGAGGVIEVQAPVAIGWSALHLGGAELIPLDRVILGVGVAAALVNTANLVVRIVTSYLPNTPQQDGVGVGEVADGSKVASIKGGRFLGPIERLAIFGLVVSGNAAGVAVVVTAKSVIRFSEINASENRAYDAEYYLVGSGLSWLLGLVGGAITLIR